MELVSERSEKDIAAERAMWRVEEALRRLAANVMRIAAGAGKSYELIREASTFVEACVAYSAAAGPFPSADQLGAVLRPKHDPDQWERLNEENLREARALEQIDVGVLRSVAGRLLEQRTQESNASHHIYKGVNAILTLRRERDERWAAQRKAEAAATRKPRGPAKVKRPTGRRNAAKSSKPAI